MVLKMNSFIHERAIFDPRPIQKLGQAVDLFFPKANSRPAFSTLPLNLLEIFSKHTTSRKPVRDHHINDTFRRLENERTSPAVWFHTGGVLGKSQNTSYACTLHQRVQPCRGFEGPAVLDSFGSEICGTVQLQ